MIKVLKKMHPSMEKLSSMFTDMNCTDFVLSPYVLFRKNENGLLLFTTLTCAMFFVDDVSDAEELCEKAKKNAEMRKELLFHRVLIPRDSDEQTLCEQFRMLLLSEKKRQLHGKVHDFTIFTTTACNARCYYCFEYGYVPVTMTEETAKETAGYIETHADGEVTLTWFGGEPLVNTKAIDRITEYLSAHSVPFKSRIVTNAYLFTQELIQRAKNEWKLTTAQITLDGTKNNYNRIKNYTNGDKNAFGRVIGNIKLLVENNIRILLHLTLSRENESDLYALLHELSPMVKDNPSSFEVLPSLLQQYGGTEDEDEMQQKLIEMKHWLRENGYMGNPGLPQSLLINSCTADNPGMVVIQADGRLNRCDHISECEPYGSIFTDETDKSRVRWWAERKEPIPECADCVLYPQCLRLAHCAAKKFDCTAITRKYQLSEMAEAMENYYYGMNA